MENISFNCMENFSHYLHENTSYFQKNRQIVYKIKSWNVYYADSNFKILFCFSYDCNRCGSQWFSKNFNYFESYESKWFVWWMVIFQNKKAEIKAFLISAFRKIRNLTNTGKFCQILYKITTYSIVPVFLKFVNIK